MWLAVTTTPAAAPSCLHGEGAERGRGAIDEEVDADAVPREDPGGLEGEVVASAACVPRHDDAPAGGVGDGGEEVSGDAGGGAADDGPVHPVRTGAEQAAEAGRAELELAAKAVEKLGFVAGGEEAVHLAGGLGVGVGVAPGAGFVEEVGVHPADGIAVGAQGLDGSGEPDGFTTANPASLLFSSQTPTQTRASGPALSISSS